MHRYKRVLLPHLWPPHLLKIKNPRQGFPEFDRVNFLPFPIASA
ncbi:hypothetical protein MTY_2725 [Moorella thermoacetica Y72]|uniref:Uncharacterized protein n=1 Tax=Moorella thermoacetica Y72 TaxID=1325331 RepID=A0A0S6UH98_NEOTH|nr:hypothetical protein MTY_2725 [Moorella thermoacetica Y72]